MIITLGIVGVGAAVLLFSALLLIGCSGSEKENRNIGYKNKY